MKKLFLLIVALFLFSVQSYPQIGYTKDQINHMDTCFTTFIKYPHCTFAEISNRTAVMFNFERDTCNMVTIYTSRNSVDFLAFLSLFEHQYKLNDTTWASDIAYSEDQQTLVYRIYSHAWNNPYAKPPGEH